MRLVAVSNRVSIPTRDVVSPGGMTVGIAGALAAHGGVWVGWSGDHSSPGRVNRHRTSVDGVDYVTLDLPREDFAGYYAGFSNQVLWPLCHGRPDLIRYERSAYDAYLRVNGLIADELAQWLEPDDIVWVHDYHLIPLADALRRRDIRNSVGFFLHTPFPQTEHLTRLPVRNSLARFLNAYDLLGFQRRSDLAAFRAFFAAQSWSDLSMPMRRVAPPKAAVFPIGIDTAEFEALGAASALEHAELSAAFERLGKDAMPIVAVDRLDYSKGVPQHFHAMEAFYASYPEYAGRASLIQVAPLGRQEIPAYAREAVRARSACRALCEAWQDGCAPPAQLLTTGVDRESLAAAYRRSKVALVTPWRDGMNLVAKEFVAAQDPDDPGVLVLSRDAGAADELDVGALLVDPGDLDGTANAIHRGLTMDRAERGRRWSAMMAKLRERDVARWSRDFVQALSDLALETGYARRHRIPAPEVWSPAGAIPASNRGARVVQMPSRQPVSQAEPADKVTGRSVGTQR